MNTALTIPWHHRSSLNNGGHLTTSTEFECKDKVLARLKLAHGVREAQIVVPANRSREIFRYVLAEESGRKSGLCYAKHAIEITVRRAKEKEEEKAKRKKAKTKDMRTRGGRLPVSPVAVIHAHVVPTQRPRQCGCERCSQAFELDFDCKVASGQAAFVVSLQYGRAFQPYKPVTFTVWKTCKLATSRKHGVAYNFMLQVFGGTKVSFRSWQVLYIGVVVFVLVSVLVAHRVPRTLGTRVVKMMRRKS